MAIFILKIIIVLIGLGFTIKFFIASFLTDKKHLKMALLSLIITFLLLAGISALSLYSH